jgi:hypothetical protein
MRGGKKKAELFFRPKKNNKKGKWVTSMHTQTLV